MGDRGNIVVRQEKDTNRGDVWFYGHWAGSGMLETVRETLNRKERWDDYSYLARIVFCTFCPMEHHNEPTSFGISTQIGDNEHDIVVVDCPNQRVYTIPESALVDCRLPNNPIVLERRILKQWSFTELCLDEKVVSQ